MPSVPLREILRDFPLPVYGKIPEEVTINGVTGDSRQVEPGFLFVAMPGSSQDGHQFIPTAINRGAAVVVGEQALEGVGVPYLRIENSRQVLAFLAASFYNHPALKMVMIGVTGTDGKTTTTNLIAAILRIAGYRPGYISTLRAETGQDALDTGFHVTTPDAPDVQRYLAQMVAAGCSHAVIETTSHGLAQYRVEACEFDLGVITNITHEHLDYHKTFAAYREAKSRLFTGLAATGEKPFHPPHYAILNRDDASYDYLANLAPVSILSYGWQNRADVQAVDICHKQDGLQFTVTGPGFQFSAQTQLYGDFNVSNCLAALATTVGGLGIEPLAAQQALAEFPGIPGRMERVEMGQDFLAIVDFAHTPNGLQAALQTARQLTNGKVIVVLGSAGLRDRAKRRLMAQVAAELADFSVLTAEDPRTESLGEILAEMATGLEERDGKEGRNFLRMPDRGTALRYAVSRAQPGDVVLACGKGHEQSMCFGTQEYPWDDRIALQAALAEHLHVPGPDMPILPHWV